MPVKKTQTTEKAEAVKEEVKATAEKVSAAAKTAAEKTEKAVKKTAAKAKTAADKTVKKVTKTAKETAAKAAVSKDEVVLQISGKDDVKLDTLVEACKADYKAKGHRNPKNVVVYVKPEEGVAYYTVAGKGSEDFKVTL